MGAYMISIQTFLWTFALALVSCFTEYQLAKLQDIKHLKEKKRRLVLGCLKVVWIVTGTLFGFPLPLFLLGVGIFCWLSAISTYQINSNALTDSFILFLLFSSLSLFLLSAVSLACRISMTDVSAHFTLRMGMVLLLQLALGAAADFVRHFLIFPSNMERDLQEDHFFLVFLAGCVLYVFADSFIGLSDVYHTTVSLLVLSGNFLLLTLLILFLHHKWWIFHQRWLEEEHEQLSAERKKAHLKREQLQRSLSCDALTGCFSRHFIDEKIQAFQSSGKSFSVAFLDMDGLKKINDRDGHAAGDCLLIYFSKQLRARLRDGDLLARIGGDEFLLVLPDCSEENARKLLTRIRNELTTPMPPAVSVSFSFGVASDLHKDTAAIIRDADRAMYHDKSRNSKGGVS